MGMTGMTVLLHCDECGDTTAFDVQAGGDCECRKCGWIVGLWNSFTGWGCAA